MIIDGKSEMEGGIISQDSGEHVSKLKQAFILSNNNDISGKK